jgi:diguanylate cyclase (GGDEF)-like protein
MHTRSLLALLLPEGLLLLLLFVLVSGGAAAPEAAPFVRLYPIVVLGAGLLLCWRFQRGRLLLALAGLMLADGALRWLTPAESEATFAGPVIVRALAIMLPATLAVLAFASERGVLTAAGLRRLGLLTLLSAMVCAVWLASAFYPQTTSHAFDVVLFATPLLAHLPLGQPATLVALVAVAVLVGRTVWRPDAESRGFLWAAIGCVVAVSAGPAGGRATLHLASAGLVLVVATIESIYAMAYHDELTGLPARRALNDALLSIDGTYTVAMVDVDHFKQFNDTHGHDVGDQVLRMVASRLARVPGGGRAFRYGGEEFTVLFPGKSAEESAPHLETLRASVAGATFTRRGRDGPRQKAVSARTKRVGVARLAVTVSIGVAQARDWAAPTDVVQAADKALYRAKEAGRNRVTI